MASLAVSYARGATLPGGCSGCAEGLPERLEQFSLSADLLSCAFLSSGSPTPPVVCGDLFVPSVQDAFNAPLDTVQENLMSLEPSACRDGVGLDFACIARAAAPYWPYSPQGLLPLEANGGSFGSVASTFQNQTPGPVTDSTSALLEAAVAHLRRTATQLEPNRAQELNIQPQDQYRNQPQHTLQAQPPYPYAPSNFGQVPTSSMQLSAQFAPNFSSQPDAQLLLRPSPLQSQCSSDSSTFGHLLVAALGSPTNRGCLLPRPSMPAATPAPMAQQLPPQVQHQPLVLADQGRCPWRTYNHWGGCSSASDENVTAGVAAVAAGPGNDRPYNVRVHAAPGKASRRHSIEVASINAGTFSKYPPCRQHTPLAPAGPGAAGAGIGPAQPVDSTRGSLRRSVSGTGVFIPRLPPSSPPAGPAQQRPAPTSTGGATTTRTSLV